MTLSLRAGQIVVADWRDALPNKANKRRPAVVIEDESLFDQGYPNTILVPLTEDAEFAPAGLAVPIAPTPENGCTKPCFALPHHVTTTSKRRIKPTTSRVTPEQLRLIRERLALCIGLG